MSKKILSIIISMIFLLNITCFADDNIENINIDKNIIDESIETSLSMNDEPKINSRTAVVINKDSKAILYGKNENEKVKMASTTKIMTAMCVIQNTNLDNIVEISRKAASTGGSRLKLKAGDKISVKDLLYGLMLRSGNDAAVALAEYVGGNIEQFAKIMNENAKSLSLNNTHFVTPHGLDNEEHYTTAYELAILTDYALNNQVFSKIVNTKSTTINVNGQGRQINNTNELLGTLDGVYGVKTGFTNGAGRCLVTSVKRGDLDLICVVLGADTKKDRTRDSVKLIEYTYRNYNMTNLNDKVEDGFKNWYKMNKNEIHIEKGESNNLNLTIDNKEDIIYPIFIGTEDKINVNIIENLNLKAPVQKNTIIGKLQLVYKNKIIKEINIVNTNTINKKRINNYLSEFIKEYSRYLEEIIR